MSGKTIYVYADWLGHPPQLMGILYAEDSRGEETYSFAYDDHWLSCQEAQCPLDPDLSLYAGRQYVPVNKSMFGVFSDSCPDRWGRLLMMRREQFLAREEGRKPRTLRESDYLLGVHDEARMGAIRFRLEPEGAFLSCESDMAAPPWTTLRELEAASNAFEHDGSGNERKWLRQLLAPGSSLGGARPKASVRHPDGSLWIAKFPSRNDETDIGAWEMVCHELARYCRIRMPEATLLRFSDRGSTFLTRRFDRNGMERIHFASAMTMLGRKDGDHDASYLDIVDFLTAYGSRPKEDLRELWRRIVFSMAVSNTDDHLRNHGFLMTDKGWRLSPAYDLNPTPEGALLSLNVDGSESIIDFDIVRDAAPYYETSRAEADRYISETAEFIRNNWRLIARRHHIPSADQERMAPAFGACETI